MGNFLVVVPSEHANGETPQPLFYAGLDRLSALSCKVPSRTVDTTWAYAASFPRANGSGSSIVTDSRNGSWLLSMGTWFHTDGCASGSESFLLKRYLEVGPDRLANELEGFFVLIIGDGRSGEVVAITDLIGSCHAFMRSGSSSIAISGSSFLLASLGESHLDLVGCQEFLHTGVIYEDRTLYREVRKLGPAGIFRFKRGALISEHRYWRITDLSAESIGGETASAALMDALVHAARRISNVFPRLVCDLTGGYDSRALVSGFMSAGVTFETTVSGTAESPDVQISQALAQRLGLPHRHQVVGQERSFEDIRKAIALTDGEYDLLDYSRIFLVHKSLSADFDLSINGSFGEIARGYWWELLFPRTGACRELDAEMVARRRFAAQPFDSFVAVDHRIDLPSHFAQVIRRTNQGLSDLPNTLQMDHIYLTMRMQSWQGRIASSTNRLWPCLSPFMFRSVLSTMLQTQARLRRRGFLIREMLARYQPSLAHFPLEHGYPAEPVNWKNWYRFAPLAPYYGRRVLSKLSRSFPALLPIPAATKDVPLLRMRLWQDHNVQELMYSMPSQLTAWMDCSALKDFLTRSRLSNFPFGDQWGRLLTMASTLQSLKESLPSRALLKSL